MTKTIENYLAEGCMRCKYGGTPKCKVLHWLSEIKLLREIVQETNLQEEMKWGVPVYTHKGKNVVSIFALKENAVISFFKGALLLDKEKILEQQGNVQSGRIIKFSHADEIIQQKHLIIAYINEAIAIEMRGEKVEFKKNPEPVPAELLQAFNDDATFKVAFEKLTKGRQRGYIIHFSQPKQSQTRINRIEKCKELILNGIGLNNR